MDVLTDKSYKQSDSLSRFTGFPTYYNKQDEKYICGILSQLSKECGYVEHKLIDTDTLESLAFKYYGRPDYYWIIAMFNDINDSFEKLLDRRESIKIPVISDIKFE